MSKMGEEHTKRCLMDSDIDQWREDQEPQDEEEPENEYYETETLNDGSIERTKAFNKRMSEFLDELEAGDDE